jgi:hypothetical protein
MVNDEESHHALVSEETPLLAETAIGETRLNGYESDDDAAPTPLSGKRAVVVAFAVVCLLFIQGMIAGLPPHTLYTNTAGSYQYNNHFNNAIGYRCRS